MNNENQNDQPLSPEQSLFLESLERPLTEEEKQRVLSAAQSDPSLMEAAMMLSHLLDKKADGLEEKNRQAGQRRFEALLQQTNPDTATPAPTQARQKDKPAPFWSFLSGLGMTFSRNPALVAGVIVAQAAVIVGMAIGPRGITGQSSVGPGYRSVPNQAACAPFIVVFKQDATERDIRRAMLQNSLRIVDGPMQDGSYRVQGAAELVLVQKVLGEIAQRVEKNHECPQAQ